MTLIGATRKNIAPRVLILLTMAAFSRVRGVANIEGLAVTQRGGREIRRAGGREAS